MEKNAPTEDPPDDPPPPPSTSVAQGPPGAARGTLGGGPSPGESSPPTLPDNNPEDGTPHRPPVGAVGADRSRIGPGRGADADDADALALDDADALALDDPDALALDDQIFSWALDRLRARFEGGSADFSSGGDSETEPPPPPRPGAYRVPGNSPPTEAGGEATATVTGNDGGDGTLSAVVGWVQHLARRLPLVEGIAVTEEPGEGGGRGPELVGLLRRRPFLTIFLPVAVIAAAAGIAVGVTTRKRKSHSASAGTSPKFRELLQVASSVSDKEALSDLASPQFAALSWMAHEDGMLPYPSEDVDAVIQRYVMALFYFSTEGETWWDRHSNSRTQSESWLCENQGFVCWEDFEGIVMERSGGKPFLSKDFHECDWEWVGCYEGTDIVGAISMVGMNLGGKFPQEIAVLKLKYLHLQESTLQMGGTLEPLRNFGDSIKEIGLAANVLTGTIPDIFDAFPNLTHFTCDLNLLSGTIPKTLSGHKNLKRFTCGFNSIFGPGLNGTLPFDFSSLPSLEELFLGYNALSGPIPPSIGDWENALYMSLNYNRLTGIIPKSISRLSQLKFLGLSNNYLTGTIPSGLFNIQELFGLMLSSNTLVGTIPENVGNSSWLQWLLLDNNNLKGIIPPSIGDLQDLFLFGGHFNGLTGTIPPALGDIPSLMYLHLENNDLEGTLPHSFEGAITLEELDLSKNHINGSMNFLCDLQIPVMYADCGGEDAEVECDCCLLCCSDKVDIAGCNENVWTGSFGRDYCSSLGAGSPSFICGGNKPPALP